MLPYDTSLLGIAPGEDLCTLVTCTPYGVNTHRLLVRGSRIPYEEAELLMEETINEEAVTSTWEEKYLQGILLGIAAALVLILVIAIGAQIYQSIAGSIGGNDHSRYGAGNAHLSGSNGAAHGGRSCPPQPDQPAHRRGKYQLHHCRTPGLQRCQLLSLHRQAERWGCRVYHKSLGAANLSGL